MDDATKSLTAGARGATAIISAQRSALSAQRSAPSAQRHLTHRPRNASRPAPRLLAALIARQHRPSAEGRWRHRAGVARRRAGCCRWLACGRVTRADGDPRDQTAGPSSGCLGGGMGRGPRPRAPCWRIPGLGSSTWTGAGRSWRSMTAPVASCDAARGCRTGMGCCGRGSRPIGPVLNGSWPARCQPPGPSRSAGRCCWPAQPEPRRSWCMSNPSRCPNRTTARATWPRWS